MDSSQYADLFLTESREHVSAINQWLLQLERDGAAGSAEPVSAIFRAVHTVKGMSATMGYVAVAELSHELETLLDRVRRGDLPVNTEVMDLLFRSADVREGAIEGAVSGREVSTDDVLRRLRGFADPRSAAPAKAAEEESSPKEWTVPAPTGSGTLVRVRLTREAPLKGVRAFLVVQALRRLGDVVVVSPSLASLQTEQFSHDFALRLKTGVGEAEIERVARGAGDVAAVRVGDDGVPIGARPSASPESRPAPGEAPRAPERDKASDRAPVLEPPTMPNVAPRANDLAAEAVDTTNGRQSRHVRIDIRRLDSPMNLIGELVITRGRLLQIATGHDDPALADSVTQASRLIGDLRDEIMTSRMVPVWQIFDRFPRLVPDASRSLGKRIEFTIEGKDIELDRSMLDEIGDPIVHLLRNAIDHGIEVPEERTAAGKAAAGKLRLIAARDRSAVVIRVSDDGRGIDRERVLARAKMSGVVDSSKTALTDEELLRIIARPGFSTAERVTDLSGRGVGIDAVYMRVRALGGAVDIRSQPGHGTTATLRLPLTLATVRALLARPPNEVYTIPLM